MTLVRTPSTVIGVPLMAVFCWIERNSLCPGNVVIISHGNLMKYGFI
jgi:hypothetical protein